MGKSLRQYTIKNTGALHFRPEHSRFYNITQRHKQDLTLGDFSIFVYIANVGRGHAPADAPKQLRCWLSRKRWILR
jgi:hypothetical protein